MKKNEEGLDSHSPMWEIPWPITFTPICHGRNFKAILKTEPHQPITVTCSRRQVRSPFLLAKLPRATDLLCFLGKTSILILVLFGKRGPLCHYRRQVPFPLPRYQKTHGMIQLKDKGNKLYLENLFLNIYGVSFFFN